MSRSVGVYYRPHTGRVRLPGRGLSERHDLETVARTLGLQPKPF